MKNTIYWLAALLFIGAGAACTLNVPWEVMDDYDGVRVVLRVVPDDADVLLNGRLIGAAYEFASPGTALHLASRQNELLFKKAGYREKAVDLRDYRSRNITLRVDLEGRDAAAPTAPAAGDQAYEAKSEPLPPLPAEKPVPVEESYLTQVTLAVTPEETAVYIDGRFWGLAPADGQPALLRLPPGKYSFSAYKPGFRVFVKEIVIPKQEKFALAIDLQK